MKKLIPWVQAYLVSSSKTKDHGVVKCVRPGVALALTKLIRQLEPPLVPERQQRTMFVGLVLNVVDNNSELRLRC